MSHEHGSSANQLRAKFESGSNFFIYFFLLFISSDCYPRNDGKINFQVFDIFHHRSLEPFNTAVGRYATSLRVRNFPKKIKALFNTVDRLLYRKTDRQYPSCESSLELCINFSDFFENKITKIRTELPTFSTDDIVSSFTEQLESPRFNTALDCFIPTTETEITWSHS